MLVGGVAPFGLPDAVPVLVDAAVMERRRSCWAAAGVTPRSDWPRASSSKVPGLRVVSDLAQPR